MRNVLVTGACGFLGRHLVEALCKPLDLERVVALDIKPCEWLHAVHEQGDVRDIGFVERVLAEHEIDTVFHLAAVTQVSVAAAYPVGAYETNVTGTLNVLEAARRQLVSHVIIASSDKSFGDAPVPYTEETPLRAHGIYATSKACADMLAQSYMHDYGMCISITRCGNLYGPGHTNWSTLIPGTIRSVLRNQPPAIRSDGTLRRDYLYIDDAVAGYLAIAGLNHEGIWNFGTGDGWPALAVVRLILSTMRSDLEPSIGFSDHEIHDQWLDATKAKEELGWTAKHDLLSGLKLTIPWYVGLMNDGRLD